MNMRYERIQYLKNKILSCKRKVSIEQAKIITDVYKKNEEAPKILQNAMAFAESCRKMQIVIEDNELIVGNRTSSMRAGVVFPQMAVSWILKELDTIHTRPQDSFDIDEEDKDYIKTTLYDYWKDKSLENEVYSSAQNVFGEIDAVAKINQRDHAQGHICPNVEKWLSIGIKGLLDQVHQQQFKQTDDKRNVFYHSLEIVLNSARNFVMRYSDLADQMSAIEKDPVRAEELKKISVNCSNIANGTPKTFYEALQSIWFLFVLLQLESNASSFSPGRMDQYLYPYFANDISCNQINQEKALELLECLFLKFNQIVYLRNQKSAQYFAGFPIGFNIVIGGQNADASDASNELSYMMLDALDDVGLPQPNLSARVHEQSSQEFLHKCATVISHGYGMPQLFNDEGIIEPLIKKGIEKADAQNYAVVGCVELSTQGNFLGWSDAAMLNLVKVLELTLNHGKCLLSGKQLANDLGGLDTYKSYEELEAAFAVHIQFFVDKMIHACEKVEFAHMKMVPSPFLSTVIDHCIETGKDVTAGGAKYNFSGIQLIQMANVSDSLTAIKMSVFDKKTVNGQTLLHAMQNNFKDDEVLRQYQLMHPPKYGNGEDEVDTIAKKWAVYTDDLLKQYKNVRGGKYHSGLYTVSAHVPMGENVGATADGRLSKKPLADGGLSAVYGRDVHGPTALLHSVSKVPTDIGTNGTLLNMKFSKAFMKNEKSVEQFVGLIRSFISLKIKHVQFNVVDRKDLIEAKKFPEKYRSLIVRVAGYTAYFTDLDHTLQDEIIERTAYKSFQ